MAVNEPGLLQGVGTGLEPSIAVSTRQVVIAVLTYARTDGLPDSVQALLTEGATVHGAAVLVIDNNPLADAEPVVRALMNDSRPNALRYVHEPRPGIASARNRAIAESVGADVLIFVDDDERPTAGWLASLIRLYDERRPAAVAGPVISEFAYPVDPWISAGRFFSRRRMSTGSAVEVAATNNLLLDMSRLRSKGLEFDERFSLTGGEDTLFTRQLVKSGGIILWCDEAIVIDQVPVARLTRGWVLRKAFSMGNALPRVDMALAESGPERLTVRIRSAVGGLSRIVLGAARASFGMVVRNLQHSARGARLAARGAGMLLGALGYVQVQYARRSDAGWLYRLLKREASS